MEISGSGSASGSNEVSVSNQRSVGKVRRKVSSGVRMPKITMPKIAKMGKLAKVTKGPAKKIGKEI